MDFIVDSALKSMDEQKSDDLLVGNAQIKVLGVGGAGCNMVSWLYKKGVKGAEVLALNTDAQHLKISEADKKVLIGRDITRGLGAGGMPGVGENAAKESIQQIKDAVRDADMVYVLAGMGGGTGTGAAPILAKAAKDTNAIVIGVVTMPWEIEKARIDKAEFGLKQLRQVCDTVIVIDNNRIVEVAGNLPFTQALAVANEIVSTMIKSIVEIIAVPSLINMDYADVRNIMTRGGVSVVGIGESDTNNRVEEAVKEALTNPLLKVNYAGSNGALIHITGGPDMTLDDANKCGKLITDSLDQDANIMWGARIDNELKGRIRVMTIITGVKSPYVLGRIDYSHPSQQAVEFSNELGIDIVQ